MISFVVIFFSIIILFFAIYVVLLIRPKIQKNINEALLVDYAHRGLHGKGVPENSLAAFKKAVDRGYGIELDVQCSADGVVMVFHDYSLERMTGYSKKLCDLTASELKKLSLLNTEQTIPSLDEVLSLVNGKTPILVELKGETLNTSLCEKVAKSLSEYAGNYCIESFNPLLLRKIRKYLPNSFRGQLYTNVLRDKKKKTLFNAALTCMFFNFISRPDFIAYNQKYRDSFPVKLTTKLYRAPKFVWTIKTEEELALAHKLGECPIFEKN